MMNIKYRKMEGSTVLLEFNLYGYGHNNVNSVKKEINILMWLASMIVYCMRTALPSQNEGHQEK